MVTDSGSDPAPLPWSPHSFRSGQAAHAAAVLGITLKEAGALDCSDEEIAAAVDICRLLADLSPRGEAVPAKRLFERLEGRYPRELLQNRLHAMMRAGSVEKDRDVLYEQDVRLALPGALSLVLVPWVSSMSGQRALLELLSRAQARAQSPNASAEDVRADLAELRRLLSTFATHLNRIISSRRMAEMIEYARDGNDHEVANRIGTLRATVNRSFSSELADDLYRLSIACDRYIAQQQRLLKLLSATPGARGHWVRPDEAHEVMRAAAPDRLAALWDGIAFDETPFWVSPERVLRATDQLTFRPMDAPVPEAGVPDSTPLAADPLDGLRALAELLLGGSDERDLTEEFLTRPWPSPAVILADLTVLAGLDASYELSYPGNLALRETEVGTRVATGVIVRRVPTASEESLAANAAEDGVRGELPR
ncbi:MAG: hypothetical protein ACRDOI_10045 [Trebonia sp.]